ncbi:putative laccase [Medicago truncatula]|uniref:Putative laccase n=1 Tax=Medicago truncatula TaxID=3880 RepID=A0A396H7X9_MEDTR|nr:putative laccase [Medicago truncatula]
MTQQGVTLWWHAHTSVVCATVHSAFIIQPRSGRFSFSKPYKENWLEDHSTSSESIFIS